MQVFGVRLSGSLAKSLQECGSQGVHGHLSETAGFLKFIEEASNDIDAPISLANAPHPVEDQLELPLVHIGPYR